MLLTERCPRIRQRRPRKVHSRCGGCSWYWSDDKGLALMRWARARKLFGSCPAIRTRCAS